VSAASAAPADGATAEQAVARWSSDVVPTLKPLVRAIYSVPRVLGLRDGVLTLAVPNDTHRSKCEQFRADAEAALTTARKLSPENGTAWLLSATLARRMNKLSDALSYIQTTAALLPRDAAVALEAGNIAIAAGDEGAARKQWEQCIGIATMCLLQFTELLCVPTQW
jgi:tetratricopeptide (TPR) repeat protein